ncbi:hypothetical protein LXA43DRAFT_185371 [Ganoderma leucocontextum]|nr:hypothetical protein LXA43DRAFT_185371 [Ganoderma leucocontextum]
MSTSTTLLLSETIWLCPRPLARCPGRFPLIPLLPEKPAPKPLPCDIWNRILEHVFALYNAPGVKSDEAMMLKLGLVRISRAVNAVALPIFYAFIRVSSLSVLEKLAARLQAADKSWDSIRRIPYSAPGRWIHALDLEHLRCTSLEGILRLDAVLNELLPLVPFLTDFVLNQHAVLSRRAFCGFTHRDGVQNMRCLKGVQLTTSMRVDEDTFVELLRACTRLEELEIMGTGTDLSELSAPRDDLLDPSPSVHPLRLPFIRKIVALSMPSSPALFALLQSPLPALQHLTVTPYDEISIPGTLIPRFLRVHGPKLTSLHLYTVKRWPTMLFPSPATLLETCPSLRHASLELPLPILTLSGAEQHHLEILSIPRPKSDYLGVLEKLLPKLPRLRFVRARDVKWLRNGMSTKAQQAGVQGEMLFWKRKLGRRGIQLLDAEWNPATEGV